MAANSSLVARRYAQAALELADERDARDRWRADLAALAQIWSATPIALRLDDPKLGRTRRMNEARTLLQGKVDPLVLNLVLLLVERGRASLIPRIAAAFERLEDERSGRAIAQVTSAIPLTDTQRENLRTQLSQRTGKTVEITEQVDPAILGGLIVRIGDELIDASVAARLRRLETIVSE